MMMRNGKKQEKGSIRDAAPRLKEYMRSSIGIMLFALVLAALVDYALLVAFARGKDWQQEDREQMEYLRQYSKRKR